MYPLYCSTDTDCSTDLVLMEQWDYDMQYLQLLLTTFFLDGAISVGDYNQADEGTLSIRYAQSIRMQSYASAKTMLESISNIRHLLGPELDDVSFRDQCLMTSARMHQLSVKWCDTREKQSRCSNNELCNLLATWMPGPKYIAMTLLTWA